MHTDPTPTDPQFAASSDEFIAPKRRRSSTPGRRSRAPATAVKTLPTVVDESTESADFHIFKFPRVTERAPLGATKPGEVIAEQAALLAELDGRYDNVLKELSDLDDRVRAVLLQCQAVPRTGVATGEGATMGRDAPASPNFSRDRGVA
jgi:hypothetical protein